ncbi:Putative zinc-finger [Pseudobutyrivibrio sp. AR14]|uniref:zf-HC2 domain-containing protein n=1 Tax=Pseudobutyrivibrio sp. AR14 TaxID=1520804 RepID=UPI0008846DE6|nr:zf-HC2 domain-containing protein [Pseudobutyrivibrio sp. AR14]SCY36010.1 Putative zinc-finger [Pseudobutyrivibrio sp. AR14]
MTKFECDLVTDLLPRYIDKKTSEESNRFIEEHINECQDCKELYEAMVADVAVDAKQSPIKRRFRLNGIMKMALIVLGYFVVIIIALFIFSYILLNGVI